VTPEAFARDPRPVAPGALHSPVVCAYCGETSVVLRPIVLGVTSAEAAVCVDVFDCVRRQLRKKAEAA
jgi:alpha-D-ribose 1-methylphosphonate 5-phosphate C-P lyase